MTLRSDVAFLPVPDDEDRKDGKKLRQLLKDNLPKDVVKKLWNIGFPDFALWTEEEIINDLKQRFKFKPIEIERILTRYKKYIPNLIHSVEKYYTEGITKESIYLNLQNNPMEAPLPSFKTQKEAIMILNNYKSAQQLFKNCLKTAKRRISSISLTKDNFDSEDQYKETIQAFTNKFQELESFTDFLERFIIHIETSTQEQSNGN